MPGKWFFLLVGGVLASWAATWADDGASSPTRTFEVTLAEDSAGSRENPTPGIPTRSSGEFDETT